MRIYFKRYFLYKFMNSLFFGLSVGAIFTIYTPLQPIVYSIGGIVLAIGMLVVSLFYKKLINKKVFFIVLLIVELVTLFLILIFLILGLSPLSALIIYSCYQITFLFGNYIVRVETIVLKHIKLFTIADVLRQAGYLVGLFMAFIFYSIVEYIGSVDKVVQVYYIHYILIMIQFLVIVVLYNSFKIPHYRH